MSDRTLVIDSRRVAPFSLPGDADTYSSQAVITTDSCGSSALYVNRFVLKAGRSLPGHVHPDSDELYFLLHGRGIVTLQGEAVPGGEIRTELEPEMAAFIPRGTFHRLENPGDEDIVMLTIWPRFPDPGSNPIWDGRIAAWGSSFRLSEE